MATGGTLPRAERVAAVCAHPDDETFALGAVLSAFAAAGATLSLVCLTHGEESTLGGGGRAGDLGAVRTSELRAAARVLGIDRPAIHAFPDGGLAETPDDDLLAAVREPLADRRADLVVVFDDTGVTGHPDHRRATWAAVSVAGDLGVPVLAWCLPLAVADALNAKFAAAFDGRRAHEVDLVVPVDRTLQLRAAMRHQSQFTGNEVFLRRLELLGDREHLRWLVRLR